MTMRNDPLLVFFNIYYILLRIWILPLFLDVSATSIPPVERSMYIFKKDQQFFGLCYEAQPCQMWLSNSPKLRCENNPRATYRVHYSLGFSKSPTHCYQVCVSYLQLFEELARLFAVSINIFLDLGSAAVCIGFQYLFRFCFRLFNLYTYTLSRSFSCGRH